MRISPRPAGPIGVTVRLRDGRTIVADVEFNFEAEFSLLDIGATSSLLRAGSVRPTVLAFTRECGVEAVSLHWEQGGAPDEAFEEARRHIRGLDPVAYSVIAHVAADEGRTCYLLPPAEARERPNEALQITLYARDGSARSVAYPVRRTNGRLSFGMPRVTDRESTSWQPLGSLWQNPFCRGDLVRFKPGERAVDPSSALWQAIVELTRMRIQQDPDHADDYMAFLDDLRNGVFVVAGGTEDPPEGVVLRPRTAFNPVGSLTVDAGRLSLVESRAADVEMVTAP